MTLVKICFSRIFRNRAKNTFELVGTVLNWNFPHTAFCGPISVTIVNVQAPVVLRVDSTIHWINHYPLDNSIGFARV